MFLSIQLNQLSEQINYHRSELEALEEKLYEVKSVEALGSKGIEAVKDAIASIKPEYLKHLKEALLGLFEDDEVDDTSEIEFEVSTVATERDAASLKAEKFEEEERPVEAHRAEVSNIDIPRNTAILDTQCAEVSVEVEKPPHPSARSVEAKPKRIKGLPDFTPPSYTDISERIVYSSEGKCFIGFSDRNLAKSYGEGLTNNYECSSGYLIDKPNFLMKYKYELKFWCSEETAKRLAALDLDKELEHPDNKVVIESWKYPLKEGDNSTEEISVPEESHDKEPIIEISKNIKYDLKNKTAFIASKSKGRSRAYGDLLCFSYTVADKYVISEKPTYFPEAKYELRLIGISKEDTEYLAKFNLLKEPSNFENKKLLSYWADRKKIAQAVTPPDKPIDLKELEVCDEVYRSPHRKQDRYLVIGMKRSETGELFAECEVIFHSEFPNLIGQTVLLREVYLHQKVSAVA